MRFIKLKGVSDRVCRFFTANSFKRFGKSNSITCITLAGGFAMLIAAIALTQCTDKGNKPTFQSGDEAVAAYQRFLSELRARGMLSATDLTETICRWRELDDSVNTYITRDTLSEDNPYQTAVYHKTKYLIHTELYRLAMSEQRSYRDLFYLREHTSLYRQDADIQKAVKAARPFFDELYKQYKNGNGNGNGNAESRHDAGDSETAIEEYRRFLRQTAEDNIRSKEDILYFIKEEHTRYTVLLRYLPDYADTDMSDIIRDTEQHCTHILRMADGNAVSYGDAMIYLAMRKNIRLICTAQTALDALKSGCLTSEAKSMACLWALLQPFMFTDDLSVAVMSDEEIKVVYELADAIPEQINNPAGVSKEDIDYLSELPMLLMKIYLARL